MATVEFDAYEFMVSKLANRFKGSPNVDALLKMLSVPIQDRVDVYNYILGQEDIDSKTGTMLDQVGSKIGVERPLEQVGDEELFTLFDSWEGADDWDESMGFGEEGESEIGGMLVDDDGLDTGDNEPMSDADYRVLLKQKAALLRSKMKDIKLYEYMLVFGAPSTITEDGILNVYVTPDNDGDLSQWERWYIENRGFKPAGIKVFIEQTTGVLSI